MILKPTKQEVLRPADDTYIAVCIGVFDLGKHYNKFSAEEKQSLLIAWEIDEMITKGDYQGKRFVVTKRYNANFFKSFSKSISSAILADIESWRGKPFTETEYEHIEKVGFNLDKLIGKSCQLQLQTNDKDYQNITAVMKLHKSMQPLTPETDWSGDKYPDWIKKIQAEGGVEIGQLVTDEVEPPKSTEVTPARESEVITANEDEDPMLGLTDADKQEWDNSAAVENPGDEDNVPF